MLGLLLWWCSLELRLPAGVAGTAAFQAFTGTSNWVPLWAVHSCLLMAAVLGLARSFSDCSRDVPAPSGALAAAGVWGIKNRALRAGLAGIFFKPDRIPAQNRFAAGCALTLKQ